LFAAKLMAELFLRLKLPIVLGELLAGMIIGPFALGSFLVWDGEHLLQIGPEIKTLGEIGAIVILFMAGLEMTPKEFLKGGKASFTVGTLGVVVPRALRMNLLVRLIMPWRLPACADITLPVAVTLKRFLALDLVFILGISASFIRAPPRHPNRRADGQARGIDRPPDLGKPLDE